MAKRCRKVRAVNPSFDARTYSTRSSERNPTGEGVPLPKARIRRQLLEYEARAARRLSKGEHR